MIYTVRMYQITIEVPLNGIYSIYDWKIKIFEMQIPSKINGYCVKIEKRNLLIVCFYERRVWYW